MFDPSRGREKKEGTLSASLRHTVNEVRPFTGSPTVRNFEFVSRDAGELGIRIWELGIIRNYEVGTQRVAFDWNPQLFDRRACISMRTTCGPQRGLTLRNRTLSNVRLGPVPLPPRP